ncbi:MAG TPA: fused MFS/spermidine synthase [Xanthobacteraceae bacterium]|nr:fused MFS/spermidine synthase [Xanthobacteraceae bacterium]
MLFAVPAAAAGVVPLNENEPVVRESIYNYLIISRSGSVVRLRRLENGATVSAIDLAEPRRQMIPYTATMFGAAMIEPNPSEVFNIGLGAGALNRLIEPSFPAASLTTVEVDPMMVEVARTYTGFQPDDRDKIVIEDGRRHLLKVGGKWDWIMLDAYVRRSQVPPQFTTVEFYKLVASRLSPNGVFVDNLHFGTELFQSNVKTLLASFPQVAFLTVPNSGNIIALAVTYKTPSLVQQIREADIGRLPRLDAWNVDLASIKDNLVAPDRFPVPRGTKILTDDFAPAEILDTRPMR